MSEQIIALLEEYPHLREHVKFLMRKRESAAVWDFERKELELILKEIRILAQAVRKARAA